MRKTKLEKGITLVALIITIVVLLILAVVSIGAVKNSGIIGHANNTTSRWEQEQANEATDLQGYEKFLEKNNPNKKSPYEDFWEAVNEVYKIKKDEFESDGGCVISDMIRIGATYDEAGKFGMLLVYRF